MSDSYGHSGMAVSLARSVARRGLSVRLTTGRRLLGE